MYRRFAAFAVLVANAAMVCLTGAASITLPEPSGPYPVGTARWIVADPERVEPFAAGRPRQIEVIAWYPAAPGAPSARRNRNPYLLSGADEVRSFATLLGNRSALDDLLDLNTHAIMDAPPRGGRGQLPLLLFSHGYTGVPAASTTLLEDLASHGYVVLSIVHPYEATASTAGSSSSSPVTMLDSAGKFHAPIQSVFAEWGDEDAVLAEVTSASGDDEQLRVLRRYLAGLHETHVALQRWVNDVRTVVSQFGHAPRSRVVERVLARVDISRFGVFGHSMGGVMAGEFCLTEQRCAAVLNLDGSPQYGSMIDRSLGRPLLMVYSARRGRLGASDVIYQRAASRYYRVDIADTRHLDFTDMVLWPVLRARHITGTIDGARAVTITRTVVREYFDQELRTRRSPLLAGSHELAGVSVKRPRGGRM